MGQSGERYTAFLSWREGSGEAIADLLLGTAVPSGKLAETWPLSLEDNPSYNYFPGGRTTVEYRKAYMSDTDIMRRRISPFCIRLDTVCHIQAMNIPILRYLL